MGRKRYSEQYKLYLKKSKKQGVNPMPEKRFLEAKETLGTITNVINKQVSTNNGLTDYYLYQKEFEKVREEGYAQTAILLPRSFENYRKDYPDLSIREIAEESIVESRKRAYKIIRMINKKKREDPDFSEELEILGLGNLTQKDFMQQTQAIDNFWDYISSFDNGFAEVFYE